MHLCTHLVVILLLLLLLLLLVQVLVFNVFRLIPSLGVKLLRLQLVFLLVWVLAL